MIRFLKREERKTEEERNREVQAKTEEQTGMK